MSLFRDERGQVSAARVTLFCLLATIVYLAVRGATRPAEVWTSLTDIVLALVGWAGGARVAQYVSVLRRAAPLVDTSDTGITPGDG